MLGPNSTDRRKKESGIRRPEADIAKLDFNYAEKAEVFTYYY